MVDSGNFRVLQVTDNYFSSSDFYQDQLETHCERGRGVGLCFPFSSWPPAIWSRHRRVEGKQPLFSILQFSKTESPQNLFASIFELINRKTEHPVKSDIFLDGNRFIYFLWNFTFHEDDLSQNIFTSSSEDLVMRKPSKCMGGNFINNKKWSNAYATKQEMNAGIWSFGGALHIQGGLLLCFITAGWKQPKPFPRGEVQTTTFDFFF